MPADMAPSPMIATARRVSPRVLRYVYAGVIGVVAVRIWITILS